MLEFWSGSHSRIPTLDRSRFPQSVGTSWAGGLCRACPRATPGETYEISCVLHCKQKVSPAHYADQVVRVVLQSSHTVTWLSSATCSLWMVLA